MAPTLATTTATRQGPELEALSLSPPPPAKETSREKQLLESIEEMTTNVDAVQERVLAEILGRNGDSEYLAVRCGLAGATDRSTFRAKVPMVTYEDLKPFVMRVANGDGSPVLTGSAHPVSEFFLSSGTSGGEPKLIPVVEDNHDRDRLMQSLAMAVMSRHVSGLDRGRSALYFYFVRPETMTPGGLPAQSATTSVFKHSFSSHSSSSGSTNTSPPAVILCEDVFQSMYAQMVCGLCHRHAVLRIGATFASGVVRAISFLQLHWRQLAADIEAGTLNPRIITDRSVREAVAAAGAGALHAPRPELAQFIRTECGKGDWAGIVTRIWPNAKYLDTIVTGSMAQYVPTLNFYTAGKLPIASPKYVSSECCFGINLRPMCDPSDVSYTILPNMGYFEFLPVDAAAAAEAAAAEEDLLVELAGVEAGREYEVVVTTYCGLNRYRVGDVLRVTGFHNAAPQFRFVGRKNVLLSLDADKTGEAELQHAVERAASTVLLHGGAGADAAAVLDYTSRVCTKSIPGHYVIYWELRYGGAGGGPQTTATTSMSMDGDNDGDVLARCCLEMEEALPYVYREHRVVDGSIGPLEIRLVRPGTFQELADYAVSQGSASMAQYKVPRCVTNPAIIQLLDSRVVSSHFSPSLPHWTPGRRENVN